MSIEEDVKRCKELIKIEHANWIGMSNQSAISNVLAEREQDKKRIKQLEKENGELIEKVKVLEAKNKYLENLSDCQNNYLINSIPKQKIKDKIEELKDENYQISLGSNILLDTQITKNNFKIQVLEELLQEEDK